MKFEFFVKNINKIEQGKLGGIGAQLKLAPEIRKKLAIDNIGKSDVRKAAVIALFYPNDSNETTLVLTRRASYKGTHSSQVSLPGGKVEENDIDLKATALRECFEEIGVNSKEITIFKEMTNVYIPPSNFLVTPFLGYSSKKPDFIANHEVAKIIQVPIKEVLDDNSVAYKNMSTSYEKNANMPYFNLQKNTVWGATAMIISEIKELLISL
jgi:8-oxo-dGTP pyrophosphatase MutT (NUDIX family)